MRSTGPNDPGASPLALPGKVGGASGSFGGALKVPQPRTAGRRGRRGSLPARPTSAAAVARHIVTPAPRGVEVRSPATRRLPDASPCCGQLCRDCAADGTVPPTSETTNPADRFQSRGSSGWPGVESNHRHGDFQSPALPPELPGHALIESSPRGASSAVDAEFTRGGRAVKRDSHHHHTYPSSKR